jgi:hypothetical protein
LAARRNLKQRGTLVALFTVGVFATFQREYDQAGDVLRRVSASAILGGSMNLEHIAPSLDETFAVATSRGHPCHGIGGTSSPCR